MITTSEQPRRAAGHRVAPGTVLHSRSEAAGSSTDPIASIQASSSPWIVIAMSAAWRDDTLWRAIAQGQSGILTRGQLRAVGWSRADIDRAAGSAGWRRLGGGVFAVHRGPLDVPAWHWAAVLRCGGEASLVSWSALSAWGVGGLPRAAARTPSEGGIVHVGVGAQRRLVVPPWVCLHRSVRQESGVHPAVVPARQRIDVAVVEAAAEARDERQVIALVLGVAATRRTTPERLAAELASRRGHPYRLVLSGVLADACTGVASCLEVEYLRRVHRAHGLPRAQFNAAELHDGHRVYRDARYPGLVVELDGLAFHGPAAAVVDRDRDNLLVLRGERTLRFGWPEVTGDPCRVAAIVGAALPEPGSVRPCSPGCTAPMIIRRLCLAS